MNVISNHKVYRSTDKILIIISAASYIIFMNALVALKKYWDNKMKARNFYQARHQSKMKFNSESKIFHFGSCKCDRVKFKIFADDDLLAVDVPSKVRFPRVSIPCNDFQLLSEEQVISLFSSSQNGDTGIHAFCSFCGTQILISPSSNPTEIQINADCLEPSTIKSLSVTYHCSPEDNTPSLAADSSSVVNKRGVGSSPIYLSLKDLPLKGFHHSHLDDDSTYSQYFSMNDEGESLSSKTLAYDACFSPAFTSSIDNSRPSSWSKIDPRPAAHRRSLPLEGADWYSRSNYFNFGENNDAPPPYLARRSPLDKFLTPPPCLLEEGGRAMREEGRGRGREEEEESAVLWDDVSTTVSTDNSWQAVQRRLRKHLSHH
jgi:hypothetical protein